MTEFVLTGAKYMMIVLFAVFTYVSFRAQRDVPDEKKKATFIFQMICVLLFHFFAFVCIFINAATGVAQDVKIYAAVILYISQLFYLIFVSAVLPKIVNLSRGLNNVMCMLLTVGFVIQTRLSFRTGIRQFIVVAAATIFFIISLLICKKVKILYRLTWLYCILGLVLLIAVLVFAQVSRGAKVSIDLKFVSIQPFEFVKILFVFFVAAAFNRANNFKTVLITAVTGAVYVIILVFCSELGTALMIALVYVLMLYVATKKVRYLLLSAIAFAAACIAAYMLFSHVKVRVDVWLNPWADIDNKGYQITQSLFAIGSGGWLGTGLYNGNPKYVPMVSNDFVFSAVSEELGAVFGIFLILLCLCFMFMIFRIAIRISRPFYKLTAFGLGAVYGIQVFLTIGGTVKFIPSTGINLPFISRGGSSILASMILVAACQGLYVISEADVMAERDRIREELMAQDIGSGAEPVRQPEEANDDEETLLLSSTQVFTMPRQHGGRVTHVDKNDIEMY